MEFKEGLKIVRKMCTRCDDYCVGCALKDNCPFKLLPHSWSDEEIEHIISAAEEWAEEHTKTRIEVLKERLPSVMLNEKGYPAACPSHYFGTDNGKEIDSCRTDKKMRCDDCWNRPAPEMYQDKE